MISVVMCTYNGEKYVKEQVNSIFMQSMLPDEIVICDDNSTDDTVTIIRNLESPIPLKIIQNESNVGVTKNFENAMLACRGDIIFLTDQDDIWETDKVKDICSFFENNNDKLMVFTDAELIDATGMKKNERLWENIGFIPSDSFDNSALGFLGRRFVTGATVALRRVIFERAYPFPKSWIHDAWLAIVASTTKSIIYIDKCTIKYRQHNANVIGCNDKNYLDKAKFRLDNYEMVRYDQKIMQQRFETFSDRFYSSLSTDEQHELNKCISFWKNVNNSFSYKLALTGVLRLFREYLSGNYNKYHTGVSGFLGDTLLLLFAKRR